MGMFLEKSIPTNISAREAIEHIRSQNGLVCYSPSFLYLSQVRP